jgi:catechol 2,3-dioxygenase-like lactoylglutathione lyase family enzyme
VRAHIRCVSVATLAVVFASALPSAAAVTGACHVSPIVADLDRSLRFYRDLLGLERASSQTDSGGWDTGRELMALHGLRKGRLRSAVLHVPGAPCGIELVQFDQVDRDAVRRRMQDPGAVTLILLVRDIDALFARLRAARVDVATTGGAPVTPSPTSKSRAVIVKDPDGHFVELAQLVPLPPTSVPSTSNVFDLRFRVTVSDLDEAVRYYREGLGIEGKSAPFSAGAGVMAMMGLPASVEYRVNMTTIPGSSLILEFIELKGIERRTRTGRVQDPGSYRLQLNVDNIDRTLEGARKVGARTISTAGAPAAMSAMQDLNNFFLILRAP